MAPPTTAAGITTPRRTCAGCSGAASAGRCHASTAAARRDARATCAAAGARLRSALKRAVAVDPAVFYKDEVCEKYQMPSNQWCYDAVRQRPVGAINQPLIHWINRPTFQQVIEIQRSVPR